MSTLVETFKKITVTCVNVYGNVSNNGNVFDFYFYINKFWCSQPFTEIIETNAKNGLVPLSHKQCNYLFREHMVRLKIISLYIYKDLRLKT